MEKSSIKKISIFKGKIAQGALLSLFWQGIRILFLALWIILFARFIGAEDYGVYAGIAGVATTIGSFLGLGAGLVMIQDTNRSPSLFDTLWQKTLSLYLLSGAILFIIFFLFSKMFFPHQAIFLIASIGLSELLLFPLATNSAYAFAAKNRVGWAASLQSIMAGSRLLILLFFLQTEESRSLSEYMWYHLIGTLIASLFCLKLVTIKLSPKKYRPAIEKNDLFKGLYFCTTLASSNSLISLDKSMVLTLAGSEISGIYSATYRFIYILMQPIDALIVAAMPKLFQQNNAKSENSLTTKYLFLFITTYGAFAGLLLAISPNLIILILGPQFSETANVIGWSAFLIPCYGIRTLITNIFMTSNLVKLKIFIELFGLLTMFSLGCLLITSHGLIGAIWTLLGTEAALALLSSLLFFLRRRATGI